MPTIKREILENGLTLYYDNAKQFRTASVVIALIGGSRTELLEECGATHVIEHLLFKRTSNRDLRVIAEQIDDFGGDINAFTDSESFCLYGSVIRERGIELLKFLSELILDAQFSDSDVEIEKAIIRQEILEALDDTGDLVSQEFRKIFWNGDPLGAPVFGTIETVDSFDPKVLRKFLSNILSGRRIIVGVSGCADEENVKMEVNKLFGKLPKGERPPFLAKIGGPQTSVIKRSGQQTHLIIGWKWPEIASSKYLAGFVLSAVLGHGASSRLFQVLREREGLCYDLGSHVDAFPDTAACLFTSSFETRNFQRVAELLFREIDSILENGITEEEFQRTRRMIRAQLEMEEDSPRGRLWRAVESEIALERFVGTDEVVSKLERLAREDVGAVAREFFTKQIYVVVGGNIPKKVEEALRW